MGIPTLRTTGTATFPIDVRLATPADADQYRSILERSTADDRYRRFFSHVDPEDQTIVAAELAPRPNALALIAERRGVALGLASAVIDDAGFAEIALIVARDSRRQGAGGALLAALLEELRARNCRRIVAYSFSDNYAFARLALAAGLRSEVNPHKISTWYWDKAID